MPANTERGGSLDQPPHECVLRDAFAKRSRHSHPLLYNGGSSGVSASQLFCQQPLCAKILLYLRANANRTAANLDLHRGAIGCNNVRGRCELALKIYPASRQCTAVANPPSNGLSRFLNPFDRSPDLTLIWAKVAATTLSTQQTNTALTGGIVVLHRQAWRTRACYRCGPRPLSKRFQWKPSAIDTHRLPGPSQVGLSIEKGPQWDRLSGIVRYMSVANTTDRTLI